MIRLAELLHKQVDKQDRYKMFLVEVNKQLENGSITREQADKKKNELAEARATIIENKVNVAKDELKDLVQEKVDGKIKESRDNVVFGINFNTKKDSTAEWKRYLRELAPCFQGAMVNFAGRECAPVLHGLTNHL